MHNILVISSGIFHPPLLGRLRLWRILDAVPGVSLRHAGSVEALTRVNPARLDAVVLYYHDKTISPSALEALDRFAAGGGGILAVHSATASFKKASRYTDILGGRFVSHPPVGPLEIRPCPGADEIFGVVAPFIVTDEAYRHELRADIRVHFLAQPAQRTGELAGRREASAPEQGSTLYVQESPPRRCRSGRGTLYVEAPIVWTRRHDAGRICYVGAGHYAASLRHPSLIGILQAGLAWTCREEREARP